MVKEYKENEEDSSVEGFLENMALLSDIDNYDNEEDAVVLMSMHAAKGLEFKNVFIVGLEEGIFPSARSVATPEELEEERRLLYVAITRAKEKLYITTTSKRTLFGNTMFSRDSRFLKEIPTGFIEIEGEQKKEFKNNDDFSFFGGITTTYTIKSEEQKKKENFVLDYGVGDRVSHKKFGLGVVKELIPLGNDYKVTVTFDSGETKNLMAVFASLKKE